jgi:hypothetical protein
MGENRMIMEWEGYGERFEGNTYSFHMFIMRSGDNIVWESSLKGY